MNLASLCFQSCPFGVTHTQILLYDLTQKLYVFFSVLQEFCSNLGQVSELQYSFSAKWNLRGSMGLHEEKVTQGSALMCDQEVSPAYFLIHTYTDKYS